MQPDENQWWVTGFNPEFANPNPEVMVSVASVDLSEHEDMYYAIKNADEDTDYYNDLQKKAFNIR